MRIVSMGHAFFAAVLIVLGIVGLLHRELDPLWNPVPTYFPGRMLFVYLGPSISLAAGVGLLLPAVSAIAARALLATLFAWLLMFRLPHFLYKSTFEACWSVFPHVVILAAAWVLEVWFAADPDRRHIELISGHYALRAAQMLYGLSLIFFGLAHFIDVKDTVSLVPHWLPAHLFWAYFTGGAFIAAGIAILTGFFALQAAALSVIQIALFLFIVWIPILAKGSAALFQRSETILTAALTGGAWIVADSYWVSQGSSEAHVARVSYR